MTLPPGKALAQNLEAIGYLPLQDKPAFKMALHKAGGRVLAVEADKTIFLDREQTLALADRHGITIVAMS